LNFGVSGKKKGDKIPGQHFLRDTIKWGNMLFGRSINAALSELHVYAMN